MKRTRTRSVILALAGIAILLASIASPLASRPAYAGPKDPPVLPILLVHGLNGEGKYLSDKYQSDWIRGGWISKDLTLVDKQICWEVYKDKRLSGIFGSAPVYILNYNPYQGAAGPLRPTAGILSRAIDAVEEDAGASDVYIVSHSMGGLLVRAVMQGLAVDPSKYDPSDYNSAPDEAARDDIYGFTTIDTPHRGCSRWATILAGQYAQQDMSPLSDFMKDLNKLPSSISGAKFCSVVVGNKINNGDGVLTADMQKPIDGTVPYEDDDFVTYDVVHGYDYADKGTPALGSKKVKDWVVKRYKKALKKYQEPNQSLTSAANTVLAIDHSGSMTELWDDTTKVEGAKSAANTLVNLLQGASSWNKSSVSIGLLQFNEQTETLLSPTPDYSAVRDEISLISADGGTDLIQPIEEATRQLESAAGGVFILLTDGMDENGNSDDSIVEAADQARAKGITIFTIGFGTPGSDINEDLLKRIAGDDSRYSYADPKSLVGLAGSLLYSQIAALEQILGKFEGTVQQGQTVDAGEFDVASSQGNLQTVLYWPGSTLEMKLTDPSGTEVASGYPGLTITRMSAPAQFFISNPKSGHWKMSVYGADTSMDDEPYYALASFKETSATATPPLAGGGVTDDAGLVLGMIALAFTGGIGVVLYQRKRLDEEPTVTDQLTLRTGFLLRSASGTVSVLREGINTIGRADDQDIVVTGETVSRHHAVVIVSDSSVRIRDAQSAAGVLVNGQTVAEGSLVPGDTIKLGDAVLTLGQDGRD